MQVGINVGGIKLDKSEVLKRIMDVAETVNQEYGDTIMLGSVSVASKYRINFRIVSMWGGGDDYRTDTFKRTGFNGQRIDAICYHGHLAFMVELFRNNPEAILKSALVNYNGVAEFVEKAPKVASRNIGSEIYPIQLEDACLCEYDAYSQAWDDYTVAATDVKLRQRLVA